MGSNKQKSGFILPTVLALSLTIIGVMVALLGVASATYTGGFVDHYQKLADEAAEAGASYATACLTLSSHTQTWGPAVSRNNLTPNADCAGANTYPTNTYVYSNASVRSYFIVGDLDYSQQFSAQVSAQGYAEVLRPNGSVAKTYSSVQKKALLWPTDVQATLSESGTNRTCAIVNFKVYCWGFNGYGQLGDGRYTGSAGGAGFEDPSAVDSTVPVKVRQDAGVMANKKIVKVFVAQYHTCALSDDGLVYCWGVNSAGQLGTGNTTDSAIPVQVNGALAGKVVTDIGGTNNASCAIALSKIYCWGTNNSGVTGQNTTSSYTSTPTLVVASNTATTLPTSYTATALATNGSRSRVMCAIANGKAYCWGQNDVGSIGDGTSGGNKLVPTKVIDSGVLSGKTVTQIAQEGSSNTTDGFVHVCAIASGGLYCWGENMYGQLGDNTQVDKTSPVAVVASGALNGKTLQEVRLGIYHSCVRASSGAYCWGRSNYGQVGDGAGTTPHRLVPISVALQPGNLTASNVVAIGAGANRGCAIISDGRTFCWGLNSSGQIGDGTTTNRNVPTESLFLRPVGNQYIF